MAGATAMMAFPPRDFHDHPTPHDHSTPQNMHMHAKQIRRATLVKTCTGAGFGDFEIAGDDGNNEETRQKPEAPYQSNPPTPPGFKTTPAAAKRTWATYTTRRLPK
jgi:hypothetical protein